MISGWGKRVRGKERKKKSALDKINTGKLQNFTPATELTKERQKFVISSGKYLKRGRNPSGFISSGAYAPYATTPLTGFFVGFIRKENMVQQNIVTLHINIIQSRE